MNDVNTRSEVPLSELELPKTGAKVVLYEYLTIGQSRELQRILMAKGSFNVETSKMDNLSTEAILDVQDKAAEFLVKEVKTKAGETIPFSQDWLYNLPIEDGNLIYNKITELMNPRTEQTKN